MRRGEGREGVKDRNIGQRMKVEKADKNEGTCERLDRVEEYETQKRENETMNELRVSEMRRR